MGTDFAAVARLLANPARSTAVDALQGGRPLAAGELGRLAGVSPSTMSEHLAALVDGGLLAVVSAGRHRYYRLAGPAVAEALEALSHICPPTPVRTLRQSNAARAYHLARTCYDHLAGALGVALLDAMLERNWLDGGYVVTGTGAGRLDALGVDVAACRRARRQFARPCLDWTERRPHLAGALGAGVAGALSGRGWVRPDAAGRGVRITAAGAAGLREALGIDTATLAPAADRDTVSRPLTGTRPTGR